MKQQLTLAPAFYIPKFISSAVQLTLKFTASGSTCFQTLFRHYIPEQSKLIFEVYRWLLKAPLGIRREEIAELSGWTDRPKILLDVTLAMLEECGLAHVVEEEDGPFYVAVNQETALEGLRRRLATGMTDEERKERLAFYIFGSCY